MSKITKALNKASEEKKMRSVRSGSRQGAAQNSWLVWFLIGGIVITIFVSFNYQDNKDTIPLSEIFPDEETYPIDVEYEFVDEVALPEVKPVEEVVKKSVEEPKPKVIVEQAPKPKPKPVSKPAVTAAYTIQVASFKTRAGADSLLKEIKAKGYEPYVVKKFVKDKGEWHRVYVGKFQTKSQAQEFLNGFQKDYANSFIIASKL